MWKQVSYVCLYVGMYVCKARKFVFVGAVKVYRAVELLI